MKKNKYLITLAILLGAILFYRFDKKDTLFISRPFKGINLTLKSCNIFFIGNSSFFHHSNDCEMVIEHAKIFSEYFLCNRKEVYLYYFKDSIWSRDSRNRQSLTSSGIEKITDDLSIFFTMKSAFFCVIHAEKMEDGKIKLTFDEEFEHI